MKKMFRKIKSIYYTFIVKKKCFSYGEGLKVNGKSNITKNTILGKNVNFNGICIKGKGIVTIGNNFHSGEDCIILTEIHNYDNGNAIPYDNTTIIKNVSIGDNVWIGTRVIILPGVRLGEGVIIQAGSVVVNDIPDFGIAGGHPAKIFKYRNIERYKELKEKNKFF